jgi:GGDEF domain-containing protein/predicted transcriptional regulator
VHFGQGYFLGRPESIPAKPSAVLDRLSQVALPLRRPGRRSLKVGEMALNTLTIEPWTPLDTIVDLLHQNRQLSCLPVVEEGKPLGLIQRQEILELYTARYSRELYGKKPARQFMDKRPVVVADESSLEEVSRLLTADGDQPLSQDFIITRNGDFFGIGKTSTLLRRITEQQIRNARYANPLTLLPGNVPIHEMLDDLLARGEPFYVAYCDIDNFKPYNDYYGYSRGDEVIQRVAQVLQDAVDVERDFVGHIGGDDFMLILRSADWEERCRQVLDLFAAGVNALYNAEALAAGGIYARSRGGEACFFPLLTLSIGAVHPDPEFCFNHHDVAALAVDAKQQAKRETGNSLFFSRRRRPQMDVALPGALSA